MSGLKALEKMRKLKKEVVDYRGGVDFDRAVDELKAEIAERFMELPVDADGVPIRLGDLLVRYDGDMHYCHGIGKPSLDVMDEHCKWWRSDCFHHVKSRTVEDVLREFRFKASCIYDDPNIGGEDMADTLESLDEKFAAEIRELMEVDE